MTQQDHKPLDTCPVGRALDIIGDRWSLLIIREAFEGVSRFSDFLKKLTIARNILTNRLQQLVAADILTLQDAVEGGAYQAYILTAKGRDLFPVIVSLRQWGERYQFANNEPHSLLVERRSTTPVKKIEIYSQQGISLMPEETVVLRPNISNEADNKREF